MNFLFIIILILWIIISTNIMASIAPIATELRFWQQIFVGIIIILGSPFLFAATAIENILTLFLPEGWNDDDDKYGY